MPIERICNKEGENKKTLSPLKFEEKGLFDKMS
jgi:hypothetical protein